MAAALCCTSVQDSLPPGATDDQGRVVRESGVHPIHFLYGHLHNSIRTELDNLSSWVLALEADNEKDLVNRLLHLKERYHFLEQVYKYHSSVEDEVVYPALDSKVKNVTSAYSVEHQDEEYLFEHLGSLLSAALSQTGAERLATIRELICKVAEIHITLRKHLSKEEAQLLPLLLQHFSAAEQAELVAQFLYCIPLDTVERVLSWLKPMVPLQELHELMGHLREVIPDRLLLQLLVNWLNPIIPPRPAPLAGAATAADAPAAAAAAGAVAGAVTAGTAAAGGGAAAVAETAEAGAGSLVICPFAVGASKQTSCVEAVAAAVAVDGSRQQQPARTGADAAVVTATATAAGAAAAARGSHQWPPLRTIVLFHHSIRGAMEVFASEAAALQQRPGVSAVQVAGLVERHRFLRSVCMFHTLSEEEVMFPEVSRLSGAGSPQRSQLDSVMAACTTCKEEHSSEVALFEELGRLLADVRAYVRRGRTRDVSGMLGQLVDTAKRVCAAITTHMQREESEVLPLLAAALGPAQQRTIVWHTLRAMPLRLLERVLPWLFSELSEEDAEGMTTNLRLGAPLVDQQLVELLLRWAQRGRWPVLPDVAVAAAGSAPAAAAAAAGGAGTGAAVGAQPPQQQQQQHGPSMQQQVLPVAAQQLQQQLSSEQAQQHQSSVPDSLIHAMCLSCGVSSTANVSMHGGSSIAGGQTEAGALTSCSTCGAPAPDAAAAAGTGAEATTAAPHAVHQQQQQFQQQFEVAQQLRLRPMSSSWACYDPCLFGNNTCELRLIAQGSCSSGSSPRKRQKLDREPSMPESSSVDGTPTAAAAAAAAAADFSVGAAPAAAALACALTIQRLATEQQPSSSLSNAAAAAAAAAAASHVQQGGVPGTVALTGQATLPAAHGAGLNSTTHLGPRGVSTQHSTAASTGPGAAASAAAAAGAAAGGAASSCSGCSPIDHIFQFHKALRRELKQLEADAAALEHVVLAACEQVENSQPQHPQQQEDGLKQRPLRQQHHQQPLPLQPGNLPNLSAPEGGNDSAATAVAAAAAAAATVAAGVGGSSRPGSGGGSNDSGSHTQPATCPGATAVLKLCAHALQQLDGRFHFLWGIYRAHSKAEDEIVFPALESKEALLNVSRAYSLDHEQEEQLFHNLAAVLQRMRVAASVNEARDLALQLRRMCAAVRASLETHVRAEEAELWPLFGEHFSVQEQQHLVGIIIGRTGAEVLQALLPWVTGSFSEEEKEAMMESLREATKKTMFDQWLDAVQGANSNTANSAGGISSSPRKQPQVALAQQAPGATATATTPAAAGEAAAEAAVGVPWQDGVGTASNTAAGTGIAQQQQDQQQQLQFAEIAGYFTAGMGDAAVLQPPQQQQRQQPPSQQRQQQQQLEVSGTVAESTNYVPGWEDIFNINQKQLEAAIRRVSNDPNLEPQRKAYLIQNIMVSRYIVAQQRRMQSQASTESAPGDCAGSSLQLPPMPHGAAGGAPCCHQHHHQNHQQLQLHLQQQSQAHLQHAPVGRHQVQQQLQASGSSGTASGTVDAAVGGAGTAGTFMVASQPHRTYADAVAGILGCKHYRRAARLVAPCCGQIFTCRLCHDEACDHRLDRYAISEMVCMMCGTKQAVAGSCSSCSAKMASYYCNICHLWDDEPGRAIYHCPFCNVCRRGKGLGVDFFHCMQCNSCMSLSLFNSHTCRERAMEGNCPVCHEYLFDSAIPIKELPCGHFLHSSCFADYARYSYTCPICCKSIGDMSMYFQMLDSLLAAERHRLPAEYADKQQSVLCQDCGKVGLAPYHWVYHACPHCKSYNTRML